MSKKHIVFLDEEEIEALAVLCRSAIKMADVSYFQRVEAQAKSALEKLEKKMEEIADGS